MALLREQHLPVPADSRRERQAARRLATRHEVAECLDLARWALEDPEGFWRPVVISCKALERNWTQLSLQRERRRIAGGDDVHEDKDQHAPIKVASALAGRVAVYGAGRWNLVTNRAHIDGDIESEDCPCCAWDERNREFHGLGLRMKHEPVPVLSAPVRRVGHFVGVAS